MKQTKEIKKMRDKIIKDFKLPILKIGKINKKVFLTEFLKNPIVLWSHNHRELPIGKVVDVKIKSGNVVGKYIPNKKHKKWKASVEYGLEMGFLVKKKSGNKIEEIELLEISLVPTKKNKELL